MKSFKLSDKLAAPAIACVAGIIVLLVLPNAGPRAAEAGKPIYVYVGSHTTNSASEAGDSNDSIGLYVFRFDPRAGALTPVQQVHAANPSWVEIDPSKRFLYATYALDGRDNKRAGSIEAYAIDPNAGTLKFLNRVSLADGGPAQVAVEPTGRHVVVANYFPGDFVVLPIEKDGRLGPVSGALKDVGTGPNPRQEGPHPHAVVFSPDNRFIAAADLGNDKVLTFRLAGGELERVSEASVVPGMGPRHVTFSRDGRKLYVIGELDGTITVFAYDPATGKVGKTLQTVSTEPPGYSGNHGSAEIAVHPSGKFLYGSNRGSQTIVGYRIDPSTGKLSLIGFASLGVNVPNNFVFDPSGKWLYVANQRGNDIEQFNIDPETGELKPSGQATPITAPTMMVFR